MLFGEGLLKIKSSCMDPVTHRHAGYSFLEFYLFRNKTPIIWFKLEKKNSAGAIGLPTPAKE